MNALAVSVAMVLGALGWLGLPNHADAAAVAGDVVAGGGSGGSSSSSSSSGTANSSEHDLTNVRIDQALSPRWPGPSMTVTICQDTAGVHMCVDGRGPTPVDALADAVLRARELEQATSARLDAVLATVNGLLTGQR